MMYNRLPCVADDSCQFAYEHIKQIDCVPYLVSSSEISPYKPVSDSYQASDGKMDDLLSNPKGDVSLGHEASCVFSGVLNKVLETDIANIPSDSIIKSFWTAPNSTEIEKLETAKRPSSCNGLDEAFYKRARTEDQSMKVEQFLDIPHIHDEEDLFASFSGHSYWKHVSIGPGHQADVPEFRSSCQSGYGSSSSLKNKTSLSVDLDLSEISTDKWFGTCIIPMPDIRSIPVETQSCKPTFDCYCRDAGSTRCVRWHITGARESLERTLGHEKFVKLGFCDMGETVAKRWAEDEENLFRNVVLSNPASLGRNFWSLLSLSFPTRTSKEIVNYYFNVFVLQNRAEQNRSDPSNADSDNDEWQESSDEEGEDSVVESPVDRDDTDHERDLFEHDESDSEDYEQYDVGCEEHDGLHACSDECEVYESKSDKNSPHGAGDEDVQTNSCTSSEGQYDVVGFAMHCNEVKHSHENLSAEYSADCTSAVTDYDCINHHFIGSTGKVVEFAPTCYVIKEMLGKESLEEDAEDGRPSSP